MKMKVLEIAPMFKQRSWLVKVERSDPPSPVTYGGAIGGEWFGPDSRPVDAATAMWLSREVEAALETGRIERVNKECKDS